MGRGGVGWTGPPSAYATDDSNTMTRASRIRSKAVLSRGATRCQMACAAARSCYSETMGESDEVREQVHGFSRDVGRLRDEVGKVIVGQDAIVEGVVMALLAGGHALLEGVPGLGKTMLVRTLADAVHLTFSRIQFTPDLMPADIVGTNVIVEDGGGKRFEFQRGPIFANVVLADEINRATPKTQSALLEAMQEKSVTVAKTTYKLERAVLRARDAEPARDGRHLSAARGAARSLLLQAQVEYPVARGAAHDPRSHDRRERRARREGAVGRAARSSCASWCARCRSRGRCRTTRVRVVEGTHRGQSPGRAAADQEVRALRRLAARRAGDPPRPPRSARSSTAASPSRSTTSARWRAPALRHRLILNFEGEAEGVDPDTIIDSILSETKPLIWSSTSSF